MKAIYIPIIAAMLGLAACKEKAVQQVPAEDNIEKQSLVDSPQLNYYMVLDSVSEIKADSNYTGEAKSLNDELLVSPGIYKVGNEVLNLANEGLYRALIPFRQNYQVIVYKKDVVTLLSSIAWIVTHGSTDDKLSDDSLISKAKHDKVYITCERVCVFTKNFLSKHNIQSRLIQGRAVDKPNGYDEGHLILEVLLPDTKKWMLVDLDNNAIFRANGGHYLNLMEFKDALANGTLEIVPLSIDKKVDISQFKDGDYSFSFYSESITASNETLIKWYNRILGVVLIDNHYYNPAGTETLKKYSNSCVYLDKEDFRKKFY